MRILGFISIGLWACALPNQLQSAGSSLPTPVASLPSAPAAIPMARELGECTPEKNHCVKPTTWFAVEHIVTGSGEPARPCAEKNGKYFVIEDNDEITWGYFVLRTEVAVPAKVKRKDALIFWRAHDGEPLYPPSEERAQSVGRWMVGVVDKVDLAAGTFTRLGGSDEGIPLSAARSIVETKEIQRSK